MKPPFSSTPDATPHGDTSTPGRSVPSQAPLKRTTPAIAPPVQSPAPQSPGAQAATSLSAASQGGTAGTAASATKPVNATATGNGSGSKAVAGWLIGSIALLYALWWGAGWAVQRSTTPPPSGPFPSNASTTAAVPATPPGVLPTSMPGGSASNAANQSADMANTVTDGKIVVQVTGEVQHPGVYTLSADARVADAIQSAGGALPDGDPDALNLAAHAEDGQKIVVPSKQSALPMSRSSNTVSNTPLPKLKPLSGIPANVPSFGVSGSGTTLDLNTASLEQLQTLPGVGPAMAERIIEYRAQSGRFNSVDELDNVKGIGPKKLDELRPFLTVR